MLADIPTHSSVRNTVTKMSPKDFFEVFMGMTFNWGIISSIHSPKYHPELMPIPNSLCHTLKADYQEQRYYHQPLGNDAENKVKITFFGNERKENWGSTTLRVDIMMEVGL